MIFNLTLAVDKKNRHPLLPFNYQYALSVVIYNIICKADRSYATFLHDRGYGQKQFKFFTFSDISIPFAIKGDRMLLLAPIALLRICFHQPDAPQHFVNGLFIDRELVIQDGRSRIVFYIQQIENYIPQLHIGEDDLVTAIVEPMSPLVVGNKKPNDIYRFYSPYELPFIEWLGYSWREKYKVFAGKDATDLDGIMKKMKIEVLFAQTPPAERRTTIKYGLPEAHKLRGYTNFRLKLTAPKEMIELALNSGLGLKNSMGMGCIQLIN